MKKRFPSVTRQLEILGIQVLLGCCAQPALHAAQPYIPGYYGNTSSILPPAANALPTGASVVGGISGIETSGNAMTVHQDKPRAVIHWGSFDVGSEASVRFKQPDTSSKVLNRVTGDTPSQIYGNVTANGQVYILNQNGILFGPGSQVNVHSLTASALNITNDNFLQLPDFSLGGKERYTAFPSSQPDATVANHGTITAGNLGSVFLIGPQVENNGAITAEGGHVGLIAGERVEIGQDAFAEFTFDVQGGTSTGVASNFAQGSITTDKGWAGMYGSIVNQEGLIRAVTALEKNGRIVLQGTNRVRTGAASRTETPVSDSADRRVVDATAFKPSSIRLEATEGIIEHFGHITAPGGEVNLIARDRVLLETGSTIDVSGTWVELTARDRMVEVQLNSEELRDAFAFKDGPLKGEKVQVDIVTGLDLADISGYLGSMAKSAAEMTTKGGTIILRATGENGEVIVKQDAGLDFSGGGVIYGDGLIAATKIRIGNKLYDLQDIPAGFRVEEVMGSYSREHKRYGLTDTWDGLYYGGSSPYLSYLPSFIQGADAGSLFLNGRKVVLDGAMNAAVVRGIYQTLEDEDLDRNGNLKTIGRRAPRAGTLQVGESPGLAEFIDLKTDAIVLKDTVISTTASAGELLPDHDDTVRISTISAQAINQAGLGSLNLYANTSVSIAPDTSLNLAELGSLHLVAQQIDHRGAIRIPSGSVNMTLRGIGGSTTTLPDLIDRITLADTAAIDVSGLRIDNATGAFDSPPQFGFTHGGKVSLIDDNADSDGEILLATGSRIDVSGGYLIDYSHKAKGDRAGSIEIRGNTVRPDGELIGLALDGSQGGSLTIHTDALTIARYAPFLPYDPDPDKLLPADLGHHLVLADNRYANSGFAHITFKSEGDLVVEDGVSLAPSMTRLAQPRLTATGYHLDRNDTVTALPEETGKNSLNLAAGQKIYAERFGNVSIGRQTTLSVAPAHGSIGVKGSALNLAGSLSAPGGAINLSTTNGDIILAAGARLDAAGTSLPDPDNSLPGLALNRSAVKGGSVSLSAAGDVVLEEGSAVDVSGSGAVTNLGRDQRGRIITTTSAAAAGSVQISYANSFVNDGSVEGHSLYAWLPGGTLSLAKTDFTTMTVYEDQVAGWQAGGFDDFTFSSPRAISFHKSAADTTGAVNIAAGRGLTINGSALIGAEGQNISLAAPWLSLSNMTLGTTSDPKNERTFGTIAKGTATLTLSGDFIDIQGNVALSGFATTTIRSDNDLRLYDYYYSSPQKGWAGALRTAGDLTLQAAAIYPAMHHSLGSWENQANTHIVYPSSFTISAGLTDSSGNIRPGEGGKLTILPPVTPSNRDIASAGGRLSLKAGDIEHHGLLAAPMGEILLQAENRILLADDSLLSTRGETMTLYGLLRGEQWTVGGFRDNNTPFPQIAVNAAPEKSVRITAGEVIQAPDALIDSGGGGSIFAYEFLPGYDGSFNPLAENERRVILPDNSVILPGETVYLEGTEGLAAGFYSLLPAEYAFLPGALVIEDTGKALQPEQRLVTSAGYTVVAGHASDRSIDAVAPLRTGYIIRRAEDVLAEGKFDTRQIIAGDAGLTTISGGSTLLAGSILGDALAGYQGGSLSLSGLDIVVGTTELLPDDDWWRNLTFATELPASLNGKLLLDADAMNSSGLRALQLGNGTTRTITLAAGSALDTIPQVDLRASVTIALEQDARISALGDSSGQAGSIVLNTATLTGGSNTLLHASDSLTLNVKHLNDDTFKSDVVVDDGFLAINSDILYLEPSAYTGARKSQGVHLSQHLMDTFTSIDSVILKSLGDTVFLGNVNLTAKTDLTLDSGRFTVDNGLGGDPAIANIDVGGTLRLQNSNGTSVTDDPFTGNAITLRAGTIAFGSGNLQFDTFSDIRLISRDETIFNGTGSFNAGLSAGGTLAFEASRYLSELIRNPNGSTTDEAFISFALSDFTVNGVAGDLFMTGNGRSGSAVMAMPGNLTVKANTIHLRDAIYSIPGGQIKLQASSDIDIKGSSLLARGENLDFAVTIDGEVFANSMALAGGQVALHSATGRIDMDSASTIDTSATSGMKGGDVLLSAPGNEIAVEGRLFGDRIAVDTGTLADFGVLSGTVAAGGFHELVELRVRSGNVTIGSADRVATGHFILAADQGDIDIFGTIDVSGRDQGGRAEIHAGGDLTLQPTGRILARAEVEIGDGGAVHLASANGAIRTFGPTTGHGPGSLIDVSAGATGQGGSVTFRASRDAVLNGSIILDGDIQGAAETALHAFRVYEDSNVITGDVNLFVNHIVADLPNMQAVWAHPSIELIPEIEVRSSGNMTLTSGLDSLHTLTTARLNNAPAIFTFRSAGNLNVTANIIDAPQSSSFFNWLTYKNEYMPLADGIRDSWDLNFIAGADMTSARLLGVREGIGDFVLGTQGNGRLIYTESGDINIAAGNNVVIHALRTTGSATTVPEMYMPGTNRYNLASFDGTIRGYAGGSLLLQGGVIQTAVSDIEFRAGKAIELNAYTMSGTSWYSAIRTTGRAPLIHEVPELAPFIHDPDYAYFLDALALERFWDYREGGNISLNAGGVISGNVAQPGGMGWDYAYNDLLTATHLGLARVERYGAAYGLAGLMNGSASGQTTHGIATMAGGTIDIKAAEFYGQAGAFDEGDLSIYARGDLDGRFLASGGDIRLSSLSDFGNTIDNAGRKDTLVELGSGNLSIQALGNVSLGTIANPVFSRLQQTWILNYDEHSSVDIHAALGDAVFSGRQEFVTNDKYYRYYLLPATLNVTAGRDIRLSLNRMNPFILAPSPEGQLSLLAGRDINGKTASGLDAVSYSNSQIFMSAADPAAVYGDLGFNRTTEEGVELLRYGNTVPDPLHIGNHTPVVAKGGRDITNLSLSVPKAAEISASRDIREISYWGQNLRPTDLSLINAGRDLIQQPYQGTNVSAGDLGIRQAGHGVLLVEAGGEIDLGSTGGIQSTGNSIGAGYMNSALFKDSDRDAFNRYKGADIAVLSGYGLDAGNDDLTAFFSELAVMGMEFSILMSTGEEEDRNTAARLKEKMIAQTIEPLLAGKKSGGGNIAMTQSTIKTTSGQDNLYIIAAGQIDVGTSIISSNKDTSKGLLTEGGGSINVFAEQDINVNESRVVTYFGGDIFMLSNHGDINAGRGSATAVSAMAAGFIDVGGKLVNKFSAPAPGSGIRTLTADPDGAGPITEPKQGAISLIAWEGVIDAGEAGISASNVTLAATKILNSENISFSEAGVGVPVTSDAGPSIGAMAGSTTVSDTQSATQSIGQQMAESSKQLAETVNKMAESLNIKMMIFKFEGFGDE